MALRKQVVPVALDAGMDAGTDPKLNAGLIRIENATFPRKGAIEARRGVERLGAQQSTGQRLGSRDGNLVLVGETTESYDADAETYTTIDSDRPIMDIPTEGLPHTYKNVFYYCDIAESTNHYLLAYTIQEDGTPTYAVVLESFDKSTGRRIDTEVLEASLSNPAFAKVALQAADGGNASSLVALYFNSSQALKHYSVNATTGAISSASTISGITQSSTSTDWDLCVFENQGVATLAVAYVNASEDVQVDFILSTSSVASKSWTVTNYDAQKVSVNRHGEDEVCVAWLAYYAGGSSYRIYAATSNDAGTEQIAATILADEDASTDDQPHRICGVAYTAGHSMIYWDTRSGEVTVSENTWDIHRNSISSGGAGTTPSGNPSIDPWLLRCRIAYKPFQYDSSDPTLHCLGVYTEAWEYEEYENRQALLCWVNASGGPIGKSLVDRVRTRVGTAPLGLTDALDFVAAVPEQVSSTLTRYAEDRVAPAVRVVREDGDSGTFSTYQIMRLEPSVRYTEMDIREVNGQLYVAGSLPLLFDGDSLTEQGFLQYPEGLSIDISSGSTLTGTYRYKCTYAWVDAQGNLHRSAPTPIGVETSPAGKDPVISCPILTLTWKRNVVVEFWRTLSGGVGPYYRVGSVSNAADTIVFAFPFYKTTVVVVGLTDTTSDSDLAKREQLYTSGGVVENIQPPPHRIATLHQERLFAVSRENEAVEIQYTKPFISYEGLAYSDLFTVYCDPDGGRITALHSMIDKLVIFKQRRIYVTEGNGLNLNASGANYVSPYLVSPSIGCTNHRTVVRVADGLIFLADDGFWHLNHGLQLSPVGEAVRYFTDANTVKHGFAVDDEHAALWITDDVALRYDWLRGKWSTYTNHAGLDGVYAGSKYYFLDESGYVWGKITSETQYEDFTDLDGAASISTKFRIVTGWINLAQIGGYARLYRLLLIGHMFADGEVTVKAGFDFDAVWHDTQTSNIDGGTLQTFDYSDYYGSGLSSPTYDDQALMLQVHMARQKCTSIRFLIEGSSGMGVSLSALALLVGVKRNLARLGTTRTV